MFKHYFTFAFRSLLRNKVFSLINIIGLAIGLASFFFITIYVVNELSYNRMYSNKNEIHRVITNHENFDNFKNGLSAYSIGNKFNEAFPELLSSVTSRMTRVLINQNEQDYSERAQCTNSEIFRMFNIPILSGDKINPLKELYSVVISEKMAKKLFNDEDPIGKTIEAMHRSTKWNLVVTAVSKNIAWNSTLKGDIFVNIDLYLKDHVKWYNIQNIKDSWTGGFTSYVMLAKNTSVKTLEEKANKLYIANSDNKQKLSFIFQPLSDMYLHSDDIVNNGAAKGNLSNIIVFSIIGLLILMIAGFNFIILSSAQTINRHKEIGFRKVIGETNFSRFKQFFTEALLISLIVMPIAIILITTFMPDISKLFGREIEFKNSNMFIYIPLFFIISLLLSIISGLYISLTSAKLEAIEIMHGSSQKGNKKFILRKVMIVFQIMIFIGLLVASLTIRKQISYSQNIEMGFETENILKVYWTYYKFENYEPLLQDINSNPYILSSAVASGGPPAYSYAKSKWPRVDNPDEKVECEFMNVGYNYLETYGFELIEGRFFSQNYAMDDSSFVINETALKQLGITDINNIPNSKLRIIGVVKDFHLHSVKDKIIPTVVAISKRYINELLVKIDPAHEKEIIAFLEERWKVHAPDQPFQYEFIKDAIEDLYYKEYQFAKIITVFTIMAIFIASLGLFGLTLFTIQNRTKEIGIRKVHGAGINNIMMMINKEFALLVAIASILAWVAAWYFMDLWLESFAYTIELPYELYILSGLAALFIVLLTVSIRSLKAAVSNPIDAIRHE